MSEVKENKEEELPTQEETINELKNEIEKLKKEKDKYFAGWQRAKADLLKFQRLMEEKQNLIVDLASAELMKELLPVLDSFDLALGNLNEKDLETPLGKGLLTIRSQILEILKRNGLNQFKPGIGEKLDPKFHEVIAQEICQKPNCQKEEDNTIVEVFSLGYLFKGQVLRPAKVKVIVHN